MDNLVTTALVGTARQANLPPLDDHPADELFQAFSLDDLPQALLLRAGARAICDQCGQTARADVPAVGAAPPEDVRACSARLAELLQSALATGAGGLFVEFLRRMHECNLVLPPELLPDALSSGDVLVREALLPVLGQRGRWLSQFRSDWQWVYGDSAALEPEDVAALRQLWDEGTISQRRRALARLREGNAELARQWLDEAIGQEKAEHRTVLLEALEQGLSADDEPLLEQRLDDRSEAVRRLAASLLARIGTSALAQRMRGRAEDMLAAEKAGLLRRRLKIACTPPEEIDRSWQRDGIGRNAPTGRGKRAYWAETVLSFVAPSGWVGRFEAEPAALIEAVADDHFAEAVLAGWTQAASRFARDDDATAAWLGPLAGYWASAAGRTSGAERNQAVASIAALLKAMPQADAEAAVLQLLEMIGAEAGPEVLGLLVQLPRPWSRGFAAAYLDLAREVLKRFDDNRGYQWLKTLGAAARALPQEAFAAALAPWELKSSDQGVYYSQAAVRQTEQFADEVRLRQSFFAELAGATTGG